MAELRVDGRPGDRGVPGPVLFARYAFPPNSHGFCGPADHVALLRVRRAGADDRGLRAMSEQFAGAWPYLQLIASATGLDDPLDRRVVEAYWVGSPRLDHVDTRVRGQLHGGAVPGHDRSEVPHPDRERARRRCPAPQLRGVLHLPVDRAPQRPPQGPARPDRARPVPDPVGQGARGAGRPGRRRVPAVDLGRSHASASASRSRRPPSVPSTASAWSRSSSPVTGSPCTGNGCATG